MFNRTQSGMSAKSSPKPLSSRMSQGGAITSLLSYLPWLLLLGALGLSGALWYQSQQTLQTQQQAFEELSEEHTHLKRTYDRKQIEWTGLEAHQAEQVAQHRQQLIQQLSEQAAQANQRAQYVQARQAASQALRLRQQDKTLSNTDAETASIHANLYRAAQYGRAWQVDTVQQAIRQVLSSPAYSAFWLLAENGQVLRWAWQAKVQPSPITQVHAPWLLLDREARWLIGGNAQHEIVLHDPQTGTLLHRLAGHSAAVDGAVLSTDGQYLLSYAADHSAILWQLGAEPRLLQRLTHKASVTGAAFSPDGQFAVTLASDKVARLWDVEKGQLRTAMKGHEADLQQVHISADNQYIVTTDWDGGMRLWSSEGRLAVRFPAADEVLLQVRFTPDTQHLMTTNSQGDVQFWTVPSGTLAADNRAHDKAIEQLVLSSERKQALTASQDGSLCVWDLNQLQIQACLYDAQVHQPREAQAFRRIQAVQFTAKGEHILAVTANLPRELDSNAAYQLWRWQNRPSLRWMKALQGQDVDNQGVQSHAVAAHPQHAWLASGDSDASIRIWDVHNGILEAELTGHDAAISALTFSADGTWLASAAQQGIRLWNSEKLHALKVLSAHHALVTHLQFSEDKRFLLSLAADNTAIIWPLTELHPQPHLLSGHLQKIRYANFSADKAHAVTVTAQAWRVWRLQDYNLLQEQTQPGIRASALHPLADYLLTADAHKLCVWALQKTDDAALCSAIDIPPVTQVKWHPDGQSIFTASLDGSLRQWGASAFQALDEADSLSLELIANFRGHRSWIQSLDFNPDASQLLSASYDGSVRLWALGESEVLQRRAWTVLDKHTRDVQAAAFVHGRDQLFSLDRQGDLRLWQVFSGTQNLLDSVETGYQ